MGCVAIFIHSEVFNANSKTEKFELKIFNDSNAKCIKIPYYESYQCKSISLNDSNLMLHFESEARNSFTQLYNLNSETEEVKTSLHTEITQVIRSNINDEKIYLVTEQQPCVHVLNLNQ